MKFKIRKNRYIVLQGTHGRFISQDKFKGSKHFKLIFPAGAMLLLLRQISNSRFN